MEPPEYDSWILPGAPDQVARARRLVTGALGRAHPLHDDSVLLTSELVTNAVVHSQSGDGGTFTLTVLVTDARVRICVKDGGSDAPPCACRTSQMAGSGRGLPILEALSHRWGFTRESGVNTVWFELVLVTVPAGWAQTEKV
ncbi:ATP-binding protein [Nonomuraea sp. NPDC046570]|uniref:ATP-binding protein n=1 Tax=Nonomuraea sp. NPDC046570 TaxID=3155255 RepID=UPI0033E3CA93